MTPIIYSKKYTPLHKDTIQGWRVFVRNLNTEKLTIFVNLVDEDSKTIKMTHEPNNFVVSIQYPFSELDSTISYDNFVRMIQGTVSAIMNKKSTFVDLNFIFNNFFKCELEMIEELF